MPAPITISSEFLAQYDAERAAKLRRRTVWYSITVLSLVGISWLMTLYDVLTGVAFTGGDTVSVAEVFTDVLYTTMFVGAVLLRAVYARAVRSCARFSGSSPCRAWSRSWSRR
ncbi:MAG: hypothetical protein ACFHWZ_08185 [Phycisphaerales bacterium]